MVCSLQYLCRFEGRAMLAKAVVALRRRDLTLQMMNTSRGLQSVNTQFISAYHAVLSTRVFKYSNIQTLKFLST